MKFKLLFVFIAITVCCFGQTSENRNNISDGAGKESYNGDLGNSWFNTGEEFYGFWGVSYSRYFNRSFDGTVSFSYGDIGRCAEDGFGAVRADGSPILNMYARMTTIILALKYRFANGYIFKEDSKVSPYIFIGGGTEYMVDIWTHNRVDPGMYYSVNGGVGARYNITSRWNLSCNFGLGYLNKQMDWRVEKVNAAYLQSTFAIGYNF
ncbi:MAG TPA: hypothetical protein VNZ45_04385 [Bacteroidia bacterium]|jgi:OOP family OmpA-OmpF porin|nr:hypothetical protein [Bacteroidia bacterium]